MPCCAFCSRASVFRQALAGATLHSCGPVPVACGRRSDLEPCNRLPRPQGKKRCARAQKRRAQCSQRRAQGQGTLHARLFALRATPRALRVRFGNIAVGPFCFAHEARSLARNAFYLARDPKSLARKAREHRGRGFLPCAWDSEPCTRRSRPCARGFLPCGPASVVSAWFLGARGRPRNCGVPLRDAGPRPWPAPDRQTGRRARPASRAPR